MNQRQQLYALLRANAGRLTSYADIWRDLWGGAPPKWAATELRTMISEIRGKLPPGAKIKAVNTRGYTLLLPARVDREPFPPSGTRAPGAFPVRAWPHAESAELARQYRAGVPIKLLDIPGRTRGACRARLSQMFRDGTLRPRCPQPAPPPRVVAMVPAPPPPKPRTCLACGRTFLSAHAGNRLCERHNGASATPWESGYRVTRVRVSA